MGSLVAIIGLSGLILAGGDDHASRAPVPASFGQILLEGTMQADITALDHTLTSRAPKGWWLDVVWRIRNPAERPLYVLARDRLSILDGNPVVLNHTATGHPIAVDPNADPAMEFVVIEAHGFVDLRRTYPLPPVDLQTPRAVVGRFAVSYDRPDPEWSQGRVWSAVEEWQKILQPSPFRIQAHQENGHGE